MACKNCNKEDDEFNRKVWEMTNMDDKKIIRLTIFVMLTFIYGVIAIVRDIVGLFL